MHYIKRSCLCWLGWLIFIGGIIIQIKSIGTINGLALVPLILIYVAYWLRQEKTASSTANAENGANK
jgi:plastocyanin domain-containing protein